jgi:hypothetical protein
MGGIARGGRQLVACLKHRFRECTAQASGTASDQPYLSHENFLRQTVGVALPSILNVVPVMKSLSGLAR